MSPRSLGFSRGSPLLFCLLWVLLLLGTTATTTATVEGLNTVLSASRTPVVTVPKTFRALVAPAVGKSFAEVATIQELDTPEDLQPDEALIRVEYAGINGGCETFRARGEYDFAGNKDKTNFRLGAEGVGTVVAVGTNVENLSVGDAVSFVGSAFAEYTTSPARFLWKIPTATKEYVGLRISALTSCAMLELTGKIKTGEKVLITAAAGGAGHFAVQFAKLNGCEVIGTCGSDAKAKVLKRLGCDHVINYKEQDVKTELKRIAPDGLDCVLEGVGGTIFKTALECLSQEGRLLQIGYISEYPHSNQDADEKSKYPDLDVADLFWKRQTTTRGKQTIYGNAWPRNRDSSFGALQGRILELVAKKQLESIVDKSKTFVGLESVSDAVDHMLGGSTIGKVVVKIS